MSNVIHIEQMRLTRAGRTYAPTECLHTQLSMKAEGEIVTCDQCQKQVSAYWALSMLADAYRKAMGKLEGRQQAQTAVENRTVVLKAAQQVETAWRSRSTVPGCPHCGEAIYPGDGFGQHGNFINRELADRRRAAMAGRRRAETNQPLTEADHGGQ